MGRVLRVAGLTLVAVLVGVSGAFVHAATARPGGLPVPYGLVLALLGLAALLVLARSLVRSRPGTAAVTAGWLLPVVALAQGRPAGDVVIPADWRGMTLLFGGVLLVAVGLGIPVRPRSPQDSGDDRRLG